MDRSERIGLGISTAGHVLVFGALSLGLLQTSITLPPPTQAIDVSIADEVALQSMTPNPVTQPPEAAAAPEIGAVEPDATPPQPVEAQPVVPPPPAPKAIEPPPKPRPVERVQARPVPAKPVPATPAPSKALPAKVAPPKPTAKPQRAPRLGSDFLKGLANDAPPKPAAAAAPSGSNAPMGIEAARSLNAEINRQIKPFWRPPSGADADRLVTLLSVHLDRNGGVVGQVEVVGQQGVTASNRAQAELHAERAVQAVMRASPFNNLPPQFYDQWKWLKPLRFDARLAQ